MERRMTSNEVWLFGHRETDHINPDVVLKMALIFGAILLCAGIAALGLWSVVPN